MEKLTVGDCFFQIRNGANIKQGDTAGGFPITRIETISNDKFNRDRLGYAGITDLKKYRDYVLEDGDLLMSHINSVQYLGRTVLYKKQGSEQIIHGMNLLSLKANRAIIDPAYARYYFYSPQFREQLGKITKKSVNQASFAISDLKKIVISVPNLVKQIQTVEVLDKTNRVIELRKQELMALDGLVKARFVEMFGDPVRNEKGWEKKPLKDVCVKLNDGTHFSPECFETGEYKYITAKNIKHGGFDFTNVSYVSEDVHRPIYERCDNSNLDRVDIINSTF